VACGDALPEQWGAPAHRVDFYDVKADLEALAAPVDLRFEPAAHPALHPGKSARVLLNGRGVGWLGELHPRWQQKYELPVPPVVFEIENDVLASVSVPMYREISKAPPVRRDVAALFDESVAHDAVLDELRRHASAIVTDVRLFDLYRGKDLQTGKKSLAFSILLQDTRKTLTDAEIESAVAALRDVLQQRFGAKLRS
jgi:phenylalanyl-tRNA synthetase beta chain